MSAQYNSAETLARAVDCHRTGAKDEAAALYAAVLERDPTNVDALHLSGVLEGQFGRHEEAVRRIRSAMERSGESSDMLGNLAVSLRALGRRENEVQALRRAVALAPAARAPWRSLGRAEMACGRPKEAAAAFRTARAKSSDDLTLTHEFAHAAILAGDPASALAAIPRDAGDSTSLDLSGIALHSLGRTEEAIERLRRALALVPAAETYNNLALALSASGDKTGAEEALRAALALDPRQAQALANLGGHLMDHSRTDAAEAVLAQALASDPADAGARFQRGNLRARQGRFEDALADFEAVIVADPARVDAHINRGAALQALGRIGEAMAAYEAALAIEPGRAEPLNNLGNLRLMQGRHDDARATFAALLSTKAGGTPRFLASVHSNALLAMSYAAGVGTDELYTAHRRWASQHAPTATAAPMPANDPDPDRRIRVGYMSADFDGHAVALFLDPILAHHDKTQFEIVAYAEVTTAEDDITRRLRKNIDLWRPTTQMSDEALARQIRADGIDILVDLSGHTDGNRLTALAHRPAPIQATYLGYTTTTGMDSIDVRIADPVVAPRDTAERFAERVEHLPGCFLCWTPPVDAPDITTPPALKTGHVTFGSFNNLAKVSDDTVALWSAVLVAVPESRLLVKSKALTDPVTRAYLAGRFAAHGIEAHRLDLRGHTKEQNTHLAAYNEIDVALDTFPYNGATTTLDALWMGVPVVSLAGDRSASRFGLSILAAAGLDALATTEAGGYVVRAAEMAADLARLARLRTTLRARLAASPLLDGPGFVHGLEALYRRLWRDWCARALDQKEHAA